MSAARFTAEEFGRALYGAYNAGGDPATAWLNFRGERCPEWEDLPDNVRAKWLAVVDFATVGLATTGLTFGEALDALKLGRRVARAGWNGKGMWLALTEGSEVPAYSAGPEAQVSSRLRGAALAMAIEMRPSDEDPDRKIRIGAHIDMRAADGSLVIGWLASQADMLATDWSVLAEGEVPQRDDRGVDLPF